MHTVCVHLHNFMHCDHSLSLALNISSLLVHDILQRIIISSKLTKAICNSFH